MKRFIDKVSVFIILLIVFSYLLDIVISHLYRHTTDGPAELEVWNDIYNGEINCDLAIYGSSRAWLHIDPEIIEDSLNLSAYNMGIDGYSFDIQYYRHNKYFRNNRNPKIILHSVDIFTFRPRTFIYNINQFLPFMLWNSNLYDYLSSYQDFSPAEFILPLLRYSMKAAGFDIVISNILKPNTVPIRNKGFRAQELEWNSDLDAAKKGQDHYVVKIDTNLVYLYKQFLRECKSECIEVILVYTPEYIEGQKYVSNKEGCVNLYEEIAVEYNLIFLDYSDHEICYNKQYFYNATHLNAYGAHLFTRILSHDIKEARTNNSIPK